MPAELADKVWDVRFRSEVAARYHDRRGAFLDLANRSLTFLVLIGGTAAISNSLSRWIGIQAVGDVLQAYVFFAAFVSGINLVWNLSHRARDHFESAKTYKKLLAEIEKKQNPTSADLESWISSFHEASLSTSGIYWWLYRDCFDEVAVAYATAGNPLGPLNPVQRMLMNWWRAEATAHPAER